MRPFLCVYGHTNLDYILSLKHFPERNTSVNVEEKRSYYGGTGANVATIASSLGVPTALCSYVGEDFPRGFEELMTEKGVDLGDLIRVPGVETPTVWIVSDQDHNQIAYVYQGPMGAMDSFQPRLEKALDSRWVHVMTGRPDYYLRVMAACRRTRKHISFDPAQEIHHVWDAERFEKAIDRAEMFFCNENELRTAMKYLGARRPEDLLEHVKVVVNTVGAKGSVLYTADGKAEVPAVPTRKVIDTTGAGDAFRAGVYAGLFRKLPLARCAVIGAAAASFVIEVRGSLTSIPSWEQVEERARPFL
ncbi:MAG TPA: carbohydrate kinase family protein [Methanomassiliicoccales archaeon]|nr:carbohydrate kinase family protein [Methanomassiliicoccales archaeon]